MNKYDDMLHLPHHVSPTRARMAAENRAAQFAPFAALAGYDAVVAEAARLTQPRVELSESRREELDTQLRALLQPDGAPHQAAFTYFQPDPHKPDGAYVTVTGTIRRVDAAAGRVWLQSGESFALDALVRIDAAGSHMPPSLRLQI